MQKMISVVYSDAYVLCSQILELPQMNWEEEWQNGQLAVVIVGSLVNKLLERRDKDVFVCVPST